MKNKNKAKKLRREKRLEKTVKQDSPLRNYEKTLATQPKEDPLVASVEELRSTVPSMVIASVLSNCTANVNGAQVKFEGGHEYVMPTAIYVSLNKSALDKNTRKPMIIESKKHSFKQLFRRYNGENLDGKKVLLWRFGGIGDLLFIQPLVQYLRATYPTCKIGIASAPLNVSLFTMWPQGLLDAAFIMPFNIELLEAHDYHITVEGSIERCKEAHEFCAIDMFKKMANVTFDNDLYPLALVPKDEIMFKLYPYVPSSTILIQARSSSPVRTYPIPLFRDLIERITERGHTVGILDQREASLSIDEFILDQFFTYPDRVLNLARYSKDLQYMVALQSLAQGFIGVDSAGVHISEALGKPTVGIYGPFLSKLRVSTYKHTIGLDSPEGWNECNRYPCFAHNIAINQCPYIRDHKFVGCMEAISQDLIINTYEDILKKHEK